MLRRLIFPVLLGLAGIGLLISLGVWQVQRMHWKAAILADMDARLLGEAVAVPQNPDSVADKFRPVLAAGRFTGETLFVLSGMKDLGGGVQVIAVLQTNEGRRLLVDRGFLPDQDKTRPLTARAVQVLGICIGPMRLPPAHRPLMPKRGCGLPAMCLPWPRRWAANLS